MIIEISAIWCSSCLVMPKRWKEIQKEFPSIEWKKYDFDLAPEVQKYQVGEKLPVLIFEKDGNEISRLVGERTKEEVFAWVVKNLEV